MTTGNYKIYKGKVHRCHAEKANWYLCGLQCMDKGVLTNNPDKPTTKRVTCKLCLQAIKSK